MFLNETFDAYECEKKNRATLLPNSMLHCLQNTKEEQEENKLRAAVRLRDTRDNNALKEKIADIFFPIEQWPLFILRILLGTVEFDRGSRLSMAAFLHGNGFMDRNQAEFIIKFYNKTWQSAGKNGDTKKWEQRFYQFSKVFEWLDKAYDPNDSKYHDIRTTYYYYNMRSKLTMFYDGYVRTAKGEKVEYKDKY